MKPFLIFVLGLCIAASGCGGNLSPFGKLAKNRQKQKINAPVDDNRVVQGTTHEQVIKAPAEKVNDSGDQNNGVQILSGDGMLLLIAWVVEHLVALVAVLLWYRKRAVVAEKELALKGP